MRLAELAVVGAFVAMIVLYLSFKLWLAERDARLLREVRVEVGTREQTGCLAPLVLLVFLLAVPVAYVSRIMF
jgi:hypothetical protein